MANLYYDVRVDIQKTEAIDSGLRFTQGDGNVIFLRIAVTNGSVKFDASNSTPTINFVKPDGTYVVGTPVESGDVWIYQFMGNELQRAGKVLCDIKFTYDSGRISSSKFTFLVEKDTTIAEALPSASYIAPMEQILSDMKNIEGQGKSIVDVSKEYAEKSEEAYINIQNATQGIKPYLYINFLSGELCYEGGFFDFNINKNNGHLEWEVAI